MIGFAHRANPGVTSCLFPQASSLKSLSTHGDRGSEASGAGSTSGPPLDLNIYGIARINDAPSVSGASRIAPVTTAAPINTPLCSDAQFPTVLNGPCVASGSGISGAGSGSTTPSGPGTGAPAEMIQGSVRVSGASSPTSQKRDVGQSAGTDQDYGTRQ